MIERRSILVGLGALFAAPAIVKAASLMKVTPTEIIRAPNYNYLTVDQITREAVRRFADCNKFMQEIDKQYAEDLAFAHGDQWWASGTEIGQVLRIRLPNDYTVSDGPGLSIQEPSERYIFAMMNQSTGLVSMSDQLAAAAVVAVAAPVVVQKVLEQPVTRRFWAR